jgi:hypothetical protein
MKVRVITSLAHHALFATNMLIRPTQQQLASFGEPHFLIYNAGAFPAPSKVRLKPYLHAYALLALHLSTASDRALWQCRILLAVCWNGIIATKAVPQPSPARFVVQTLGALEVSCTLRICYARSAICTMWQYNNNWTPLMISSGSLP